MLKKVVYIKMYNFNWAIFLPFGNFHFGTNCLELHFKNYGNNFGFKLMNMCTYIFIVNIYIKGSLDVMARSIPF